MADSPYDVEWDEKAQDWLPATGRPGASIATWDGDKWVRTGKNPEGPGALRRGIATGIESTKGLIADVLPAMIQSAFGYDEAAQKNLDAYKQRMDELKVKGLLAQSTYQDVQNLSTLGSYVGEAVGEAVPSLATSLLGGLGLGAAATRMGAGRLLSQQVAKRAAALEAEAAAAGATLSREAAIKAATSEVNREVGTAVGAFGASALQNVPESFASLADEGQKSLGSALVVGSLKSVLDTLGPIRLLSKTRGTDFSDKLTDLVSARLLKGRPGAAGALGGTLETLVLEGITEGTQELLDQTAKTILADKSVDWTQVVDAALKGGIGAAPAGGAAGAYGARRKAAAGEERARIQGETQARVEGEKTAAEGEQAYTAQRLAGEVPEPPAPPRTTNDLYEDAFRSVRAEGGPTLSFRYEKGADGKDVVAQNKKGEPFVEVDSRYLNAQAQQLAASKTVDLDTGKPYTVGKARKVVERNEIDKVRSAVEDLKGAEAQRVAMEGQPETPNVAPRETPVQGPDYRRQQAQQIVAEVQRDPSLADIPGVRQQYEEAKNFVRTEEDAAAQLRRQERELGPLVGEPFTVQPGEIPATPKREQPTPVAPAPEERRRLTPQQTKTLEDLLKQVPPGGQVSIPGVQRVLGTSLQETRDILREYAPAKKETQAGMATVSPELRLTERDNVFKKPKEGEVAEPFAKEPPTLTSERGGARAPAEMARPLPIEVASPLTEVQGTLQTPPMGMGQREWALLHNTVVEAGPSKLLTLPALEKAVGKKLAPKEAASLWEGLTNSGAVRREGMGYRVVKDAPRISEFAPKVVGGPTMAQPKLVVPADAPKEVQANVEAAKRLMKREQNILDANPTDYSCR